MEIFLLILPIIMEFITECRKTDSREKIEAGLHNPGIPELFACIRALRSETDLRGRALRREARKQMQRLRELPAAEITRAMDQAEADYLAQQGA